MPTDTMRLLSLGSFPAPGTPITLQHGTSISFDGLVVSDNNTAADALGSNPPPFGTTIAFATGGSGITLQGASSYTVPNALSPVGPFGVTVAADKVEPGDEFPSNVFLLLNIQSPGRSLQQFSWPVTITP